LAFWGENANTAIGRSVTMVHGIQVEGWAKGRLVVLSLKEGKTECKNQTAMTS